ncbi:MAG: CBS domain-containing protein [Saccharospirillum sp.]|nr:CBS domain-containing protein [Saccharospirillum sp.]
MSVAKIMNQDFQTVDMDDPLEWIKKLFDEQRFHHVLVMSKGKLVGVISDRDVLKNISPYVGTVAETSRDTATLKKKAHQIMTRQLVTVTDLDTVMTAVKTFNRHRISCLPVLNARGRPVGLLTWRDILRAMERIAERRSPNKAGAEGDLPGQS